MRPSAPQAFPIVWPMLYADIAAVSAATLDHLHDEDGEHARTYAALLAANLVLNAGVSARGASGAALGLYPAWCAFATLLSTRIWQLNRSG
jgi:benzodiazapine receptor